MDKAVIVLAKAFPPMLGGVETYSAAIANEYQNQQFKTIVITSHNGTKGKYHNDAGVEIHNVGITNQLMTALRILWVLLLTYYRTKNVVFIHATTWRIAIPVLLLRLHVPLVLTVHGREVLATSGWLKRIMHAVFEKAALILVISDCSKSLCFNAKNATLNAKLRVSWNGASPWAFHFGEQPVKIQSDMTRVLCSARLIARKNIAGAINAFSYALTRNPALHLHIAGDGPELASLKRLVADLNLQNHVTFVGYVLGDRLSQLYKDADIFLHPHSHAHDWRDVESFCLVIADAMAAKLPVIAGKDGAPAEYITHGDNGYLIDGQDINGMGELIYQLSISVKTREMVANRAHLFASKHFRWKQHLEPVIQMTKTRG